MRKLMTRGLVTLLLGPGLATAAAYVGEPAPDFELPGLKGNVHHLSDYRGQVVVLHFTDFDCPYVNKHHAGGSIRYLQSEVTSGGGKWLSVISKDHVDPGALQAVVKQRGLKPSATLVDEGGQVAEAYGAQRAPTIYIVDRNGTLVYAGGIDDKPTTRSADIAGAKNFVRATLADLNGGYGVLTPTSPAYGCPL